MFDVQVTEIETYKESAGFAPGDHAVMAASAYGRIGMSICYDVRFAYLYRKLAQAGAEVLTVPAAFSPATGPMHWEPLLRARAIETGCYVIAPAQTGTHASSQHKTRDTYGHSLVISPWGEILMDAGTAPGVYKFELDMGIVSQTRQRVPSMAHRRPFERP